MSDFPLSAVSATAIILAVAAVIRLLIIPKFALMPGPFQLISNRAWNYATRSPGFW